jgi:hypothetical protein
VSTPNLNEAVKFIRSKSGLKHWTDEEIKNELQRSINEYSLSYTTGSDGKIDGIVFGKFISREKFHVQYIAGQMKHFIKYMVETFPDIKYLTGFRKDRLTLKTFKVSKFKAKINYGRP